jgi:mono/diheme cytochrome c family protein
VRHALQFVLGFLVAGNSCAVFAAADSPTPAPAAVSFDSTVKPFVKQNCYGCHNAKLKVGGLNLEALAAESSLGDHRDTWETIIRRMNAAEMPPKPLPRPDPKTLQAVVKFLEDHYDQVDANTPPQAGRVTARRLNRAEYNNTIHDLLDVKLDPADDFPQDDSGYGFDNIGDVLSLSPILMERYLAAAEKVSRAAVFGPDLIKPSVTRLSGARAKIDPIYMQPPADYDETGLDLPNSFHALYHFPVDADYDFRVVLGGVRPQGSEPIEVTLWIDGQALKSAPVSGGRLPESAPWSQDFDSKSVVLRARVSPGEHWVALALPHYYEGLPASFHGPRPSTLPPPPDPDFAVFIKPPKSESAERLAQYKVRLANGIRDSRRINSVKVSNVELQGPYDQQRAPSLATARKIYVCGHLDGKHQPGCARRIVTHLAEQAFRRPVSSAEVDRYLKLFASAQADGGSFNDGIALAMEGLLVSPDFLFRIETSPMMVRASTANSQPVSQYALASRLSYFLWNSMPDAELLRYAVQGTLRKPDVLKAQVDRMLRDPRSSALAENFGGQWLEFRALESVKPDHERFPEYDTYLRFSMQRETELFLESVFREDRSILDLVSANYTFVNERLADFYGIPNVKGPQFRKVDLSATPMRGGVITEASVLTVSSYATRTSPVLRGKWILDNILNDPPPPPPPGVPNLNVEEVGTSVSLRKQLESHRANAVCASCHQKMDPLGFGLENFDAIGSWRTHDGKFDIDAKGTLPGGETFDGAAGLKAIVLEERDAFAQCLVEKLLTYALGRGVEHFDRPAIKAITRQVAANDYRFNALVFGIVSSVPFQMQQDAPPSNGNETKKSIASAAPTPSP